MSAGTASVRSGVRLATDADHDRIRHIFMSTLALGRPVTVAGVDAYADFSLGWYLDPAGGDVAVHTDADEVDGYILVCTDEDACDRQRFPAAARYVFRLGWLAVRGRMRGEAWRFHRLRIRDGWNLYNAGPVRPAEAHVHLNLLPSARAHHAGRQLVAAADEIVSRAGLDAWYAEINSRAGRRAGALVRLGAEIIDRSPNHTLSYLTGDDVERLTILRRL